MVRIDRHGFRMVFVPVAEPSGGRTVGRVRGRSPCSLRIWPSRSLASSSVIALIPGRESHDGKVRGRGAAATTDLGQWQDGCVVGDLVGDAFPDLLSGAEMVEVFSGGRGACSLRHPRISHSVARQRTDAPTGPDPTTRHGWRAYRRRSAQSSAYSRRDAMRSMIAASSVAPSKARGRSSRNTMQTPSSMVGGVPRWYGTDSGVTGRQRGSRGALPPVAGTTDRVLPPPVRS